MSRRLSLQHLIDAVGSVFEAQRDVRRGKNIQYGLADVGLAALSVFVMQSPSFLAYQRDMERRKGTSNAQSLFGLRRIPSDNQIRNLLDPLAPDALFVVFRHVVAALEEAGELEAFRDTSGRLLVALDGTDYFSSQKVSCPNCSQRVLHSGKTLYTHGVVTPVLVSPDKSEVVALEPAFIRPQDGGEKQDCELAAAKRWLEEQARHYPLGKVTLLGDDLYCHQPWCEAVLAKKMAFIFVCKPDSHATLYAYLDLHAPLEKTQRVWNGRFAEIHHYRYANGLPLKEGDDALLVNWCELSIYQEDGGELLFRNSFATNHPLDDQRAPTVVAQGRARWKVENENNNVLKTKGYHFEHNYGHGKAHLSALLLTLILLAFLFHTVLALTHGRYQQIRKALGARQTFFDDLRALTRYHLFSSWDALLDFMFEGLELSPDTS